MSLKVWLRAARAPFLSATAVPVLLGTALAFRRSGTLDGFHFAAALVGALLIHAGANLLNEHADHLSGADAANLNRTPFSGGSGTIQEGLVSPGAVLRAAVLCMSVGAALGLYLNAATRGNVVLALGVFGLALGWCYSERPVRLGYRGGGVGELAVALGFGPVTVSGAYYVQVQSLDAGAFLASLPVAVLIALVLIVNGFPDHDADRAVGKRTLVVTLGRRRSVTLYLVLLALVHALTAALVWSRVLPPACLLAFLTLPVAIRAASVLRRSHLSLDELLPANAGTIALHGAFGLLLSAGLVIDRLLAQ